MISNNLDLIAVGAATLVATISGILGLRKAKRDSCPVAVVVPPKVRAVVVDHLPYRFDVGAIREMRTHEITQEMLNRYGVRVIVQHPCVEVVPKKQVSDFNIPDFLDLAYAK